MCEGSGMNHTERWREPGLFLDAELDLRAAESDEGLEELFLYSVMGKPRGWYALIAY